MAGNVRLTKLAKRAGCAAKHPPGFLHPLVRAFPPVRDPNVLLSGATMDDAGLLGTFATSWS